MQWILWAGLTFVAAMSVVWPLVRTPRGLSRGAIDVAFYKDQLAAIERDAAEGVVAPADAEAAKAEAGRRLLAAADAAPRPTGGMRTARFALFAACAFVLASGLGFYAFLGAPGVPDQPLSARLAESPGRMDLMAAVAKIEAHLAEDPKDGRGYEVLAPVYMRLGRFDDAVKASEAALRLNGDTPERQARYGEALVAAADGEVTAPARRAFEAASAKDPSAPLARFYLGLAAAQDGDGDRARDLWEALLKDAPAGASWAPTVRRQLAALSAPQDGAGARPAGPAANPALAARIKAMPGAEQSAAIKGMVDALAARLARDGQDVEGWLRLMRAYSVLHEADKAKSALNEARRNLAGDPTASARIDALARELGLEG